MSDLNHRLVLQHLRNLNHLMNTFDESSQILQQHLQRQRTNNIDDMFNNFSQYSPNLRNTRTRQHSYNHNYLNNTVPFGRNSNNSNSNDDTTYILRFETLLPELINNLTRNAQNRNNNDNNRFEFTISNLNENNLSDISNLLQSNDILDVEKYELIQNPINDVCPITRERFHGEQNVMMICSCKHIFNKSSLAIWINGHDSCPYCRQNISRNREHNNNENTTNRDTIY